MSLPLFDALPAAEAAAPAQGPPPVLETPVEILHRYEHTRGPLLLLRSMTAAERQDSKASHHTLVVGEFFLSVLGNGAVVREMTTGERTPADGRLQAYLRDGLQHGFLREVTA